MEVSQINALEPAYVPQLKLNLNMDWLLTRKCNFDCNYCDEIGHNNARPHPDKELCLDFLDHVYRYGDIVNSIKKERNTHVNLNILGGEVLYHPDIVELLEQSTKKHDKFDWGLDRQITTSASCQLAKWKEICKHTERFTFSYHADFIAKTKFQKNFIQNLEYCVEQEHPYYVVVLLDPKPGAWEQAVRFYKWCQKNRINARPRILDGPSGTYSSDQIKLMQDEFGLTARLTNQRQDFSNRACCGGRSICVNRNLKQSQKLIPNDNGGYKGWWCSVKLFFFHADCDRGLFFNNKDCQQDSVAAGNPVATTDTIVNYLDHFEETLSGGDRYLIKCKQQICHCGVCAPKSRDKDTVNDILEIYCK